MTAINMIQNIHFYFEHDLCHRMTSLTQVFPKRLFALLEKKTIRNQVNAKLQIVCFRARASDENCPEKNEDDNIEHRSQIFSPLSDSSISEEIDAMSSQSDESLNLYETERSSENRFLKEKLPEELPGKISSKSPFRGTSEENGQSENKCFFRNCARRGLPKSSPKTNAEDYKEDRTQKLPFPKDNSIDEEIDSMCSQFDDARNSYKTKRGSNVLSSKNTMATVLPKEHSFCSESHLSDNLAEKGSDEYKNSSTSNYVLKKGRIFDSCASLSKDVIETKMDLQLDSTTSVKSLPKMTRRKTNVALSISSSAVFTPREETILPFSALAEHAYFANYKENKQQPSENKEINTDSFALKVCDLKIDTCISAVLFDEYYVLIFQNRVVKKQRNSKESVSEKIIKNAYRLCQTGSKSTMVAVLDLPTSKITVLETKNNLFIQYTIALKVHLNLTNICHLSTYTNNPNTLPKTSHVFCVTRSGPNISSSDIISTLSPEPLKPYELSSYRPVYQARMEDISKMNIRGISGLTSLAWDIMVISCSEGVKCLKLDKEKTVLWTVESTKSVTDVCCINVFKEKHVLASVQNDNRIMLLDKNGKIVKENVLKEGSMMRPDKISVRNETILVKQFDESVWASFVTEV